MKPSDLEKELDKARRNPKRYAVLAGVCAAGLVGIFFGSKLIGGELSSECENPIYLRPGGLPPANGYSHVVAFSGRMIVISGQVPLDASGALVGRDDPRSQIRQVFANLKLALAAAGAGMEHIVKLNVYLTDLSDLEAFRSVRDEYISLATPPASSLVQVRGLVNPAFRVEIDALAVL